MTELIGESVNIRGILPDIEKMPKGSPRIYSLCMFVCVLAQKTFARKDIDL